MISEAVALYGKTILHASFRGMGNVKNLIGIGKMLLLACNCTQ